MAKLPHGPFGPFIGKAGPLIGYLLNGQAVIRAVAQPTHKPLTLPQVNNCSKLSLVNKLISGMSMFLKITFGPESRGTTKNWQNLAVQYNNPAAIKGYHPNLEIEYSKVVLSHGNLTPAVNATVTQNEAEIIFNWDGSAGTSGDRVMMLLYFPHDHTVVYETGGLKRSVGSDKLLINNSDINMHMEAFITFKSEDGENFSDSVYIGSLNRI